MIEEGVAEERLIVLKFTQKEESVELHWEHAREFEYRGEMYDIISSEVKGDTTYYSVWWDREETALNRQLEAFSESFFGDGPLDDQIMKSIHSYFKSLYFPAGFKFVFYVSTQGANSFKTDEVSVLIEPESPPFPPPQKG